MSDTGNSGESWGYYPKLHEFRTGAGADQDIPAGPGVRRDQVFTHWRSVARGGRLKLPQPWPNEFPVRNAP